MAAVASSAFEGNTYTKSMKYAVRQARNCGVRHERIIPGLIRLWHQTITGHELGEDSYRTCEVTFGKFKASQLVHYKQVPLMMVTLCQDIHGLMAQRTPKIATNELAARMLMRFVRIQPFQDANKRTGFCLVNYMLAYRAEPDVLVPRLVDCKAFADAIYNNDEEAVIHFIGNWRKPVKPPVYRL